jgi:hypothetical protein
MKIFLAGKPVAFCNKDMIHDFMNSCQYVVYKAGFVGFVYLSAPLKGVELNIS